VVGRWRTTVFISYAHADAAWRERLQTHLAPLAQRGLIDVWDDTRIQPGEPWQAAIAAAIDRAAVAVLLVSAVSKSRLRAPDKAWSRLSRESPAA
jgi:nucleotide-binding universal stress UspA family protein